MDRLKSTESWFLGINGEQSWMKLVFCGLKRCAFLKANYPITTETFQSSATVTHCISTRNHVIRTNMSIAETFRNTPGLGTNGSPILWKSKPMKIPTHPRAYPRHLMVYERIPKSFGHGVCSICQNVQTLETFPILKPQRPSVPSVLVNAPTQQANSMSCTGLP